MRYLMQGYAGRGVNVQSWGWNCAFGFSRLRTILPKRGLTRRSAGVRCVTFLACIRKNSEVST